MKLPRRESLSADAARRIAISSALLAKPRPGRATAAAVERVARDLGVLQIDSVNVFARAHHMPPFSRLGPYPLKVIDDLAYRKRRLFEYWAHVACYVPIERYSLWVWKMRNAHLWGLGQFAKENPGYVKKVREQVERHGPISTKELEDPGRKRGPWWGWAQGKRALEWLFFSGELSVAERRNFTRYYDLTERVIPSEVLALPVPSESDAKRELVLLAARALGVGTINDIADYYRLKIAETKRCVDELVAEGSLLAVTVEGWDKPAYMHRSAVVPTRVRAQALLSPFDPLVWYRPRTERIFDFHYRIEIYTPKEHRQFGYYTLPFLFGERIGARVDLKHDRKAAELLVRSVHPEPGVAPLATLEALSDELMQAVRWVGAERLVVEGRSAAANELRKLSASLSDM